MSSAKPFEFLEVTLPADGDLRLILSECTPAENSPWGAPAYTFAMQGPGGDYMGHIRLRVGGVRTSSDMPDRSVTPWSRRTVDIATPSEPAA